MSSVWRKCAICKKDINHGQIYQQCSVSTCRKNSYCSVDCWEVHVPVLNHKVAFAEEQRAPRAEGKRIIVASKPAAKPVNKTNANVPKDTLIVASKLKAYVKAKYDLNTSQNVMNKLSDIVRDTVDQAIDKALAEGRKTLMDRDF